MNALDIDLVRQYARKNAEPAHSLDRMTALQMARRTVIFTVDSAGIAALVDKARQNAWGSPSAALIAGAALLAAIPPLWFAFEFLSNVSRRVALNPDAELRAAV
jgi:hypothetical protein